MPQRLFIVLPLLLALCWGCVAEKEHTFRPPPPKPEEQARPAYKSKRAVQVGAPVIYEADVRDWFKKVRFPGYRQISIYSEFHPDDGSLVARYAKGGHVLYLSYIDNQRMSQFGIARSAREMVAVGCAGEVREFEIAGRTWYGDDTTKPTLGLDVSPNVKILLMGYENLDLQSLVEIAEKLPVDALAAKAAK
jgi:hypothetical protein